MPWPQSASLTQYLCVFKRLSKCDCVRLCPDCVWVRRSERAPKKKESKTKQAVAPEAVEVVDWPGLCSGCCSGLVFCFCFIHPLFLLVKSLLLSSPLWPPSARVLRSKGVGKACIERFSMNDGRRGGNAGTVRYRGEENALDDVE